MARRTNRPLLTAVPLAMLLVAHGVVWAQGGASSTSSSQPPARCQKRAPTRWCCLFRAALRTVGASEVRTKPPTLLVSQQ
jgi:hypothetical protein